MARLSEQGHKDVFSFIDANDTVRLGAHLVGNPQAAATRNAENVSALLYALYRRNYDAVRMLRDRLLSLDLWEAAARGEARAVRDLLATPGAGVNAFSPDGFTALQLASFFGRNEVVELLLERNADPNLVSQNAQGIRALHGAAAGHHLEIVGRLIAAGTDVDARQASGNTALDTAIKSGDENIVRELTRPR